MSHDIYEILNRFEQLNENIDAAQKSVKQLPALFKPKNTSPQLSGPYPGKNATRGYLVGEDEEIAQDPIDEGDVVPINRGGYNKLRNKEDYLDKRDVLYKLLSQAGIDPEIRDAARERLAHLDQAARMQGIIESLDENNPTDAVISSIVRRIMMQRTDLLKQYGPEAVLRAVEEVADFVGDVEEIGSSDVSAWINQVERALQSSKIQEDITTGKYYAIYTDGVPTVKYKTQDEANATAEDLKREFPEKKIEVRVVEGQLAEAIASEDILSTMKKKLGDYLQDVATAIKTDDDLKDKLPQTVDQVKAVKTITTDDGHEIKIHGNEDDGFRVTIKNKPSKSSFKSLDEAVMACEMYCARRRMAETNADYVEEKR